MKYLCLSQAGLTLNVLNVARLHCHKSMYKPTKFDFIPQNNFPCEKVDLGMRGDKI